MDCLFCKIAAGEIPSNKVYEDDDLLAFYDIDPQAPVHILIIPKEHISSIDEINEDNCAVVGRVFTLAASSVIMYKVYLAASLSKSLGLEKGYRVVSNCGSDAGQSVPHLHFHLLAGRELGWPPG